MGDTSDAGRGFMTTNEVADYYRTTPSTARYWRAIGYGPKGRRVGRRVLYERSEVEKFWDTLKDGTQAPDQRDDR